MRTIAILLNIQAIFFVIGLGQDVSDRDHWKLIAILFTALFTLVLLCGKDVIRFFKDSKASHGKED